METKIVILILIFTLFPSVLAHSDDSYLLPKTIVLSGSQDTKNSLQGRFLEMVYTEAFKRLGIKLEYTAFPAKRSSAMSDNGYTDGEITRVYDYANTHPNMVRVEEHVLTYTFNAYATKPGIKLHGWDSLKGTNYKVEYKQGVQNSKDHLTDVVDKEMLSSVIRLEHGFKKLMYGRTDILVAVHYELREQLRSDEFKDSGIYVAGIMGSTTSHAFLHKKHKSLAPKISNILAQMKSEGLIKKYEQYHLSRK